MIGLHNSLQLSAGRVAKLASELERQQSILLHWCRFIEAGAQSMNEQNQENEENEWGGRSPVDNSKNNRKIQINTFIMNYFSIKFIWSSLCFFFFLLFWFDLPLDLRATFANSLPYSSLSAILVFAVLTLSSAALPWRLLLAATRASRWMRPFKQGFCHCTPLISYTFSFCSFKNNHNSFRIYKRRAKTISIQYGTQE